MNQLSLNKDYSHIENYKKLIDHYIEDLSVDPFKNHQKILETCHVGKFLMFFNNRYQIEKLYEKPDFIIKSEAERFGLEHQILIDPKSKEKEGGVENIFRIAEKELTKDKDIPSILANIYIKNSFRVEINKKQQIINKICQIIKVYTETGNVINNEIIDRISSMRHTQLSLCPNLGAWWQKKITSKIILSAIRKKESKITDYIKNTNLPQWLLIVIGSSGESSFRYEKDFDMAADSPFDKIYLLEDLYNNLYEIK